MLYYIKLSKEDLALVYTTLEAKIHTKTKEIKDYKHSIVLEAKGRKLFKYLPFLKTKYIKSREYMFPMQGKELSILLKYHNVLGLILKSNSEEVLLSKDMYEFITQLNKG